MRRWMLRHEALCARLLFISLVSVSTQPAMAQSLLDFCEIQCKFVVAFGRW